MNNLEKLEKLARLNPWKVKRPADRIVERIRKVLDNSSISEMHDSLELSRKRLGSREIDVRAGEYMVRVSLEFATRRESGTQCQFLGTPQSKWQKRLLRKKKKP